MGMGCVMVLHDPDVARHGPRHTHGPSVSLERLSALRDDRAAHALAAVTPVLCDAFGVEDDRRAGVEAETAASLANPAFMHYLVRVDGRPAAVARRATFEGASYLSSIGTATWARGRGLGELVTLAATADAVAAGSEWTYLGVFADNEAAIRLYRIAGFEIVGEPVPDLLLVG
jgi:ribosomal protein S18 acetylase RimI-like enzyme